MEQESWLDYLTKQDVVNFLARHFGYEVLAVNKCQDVNGKLTKIVAKIRDFDEYCGFEETSTEIYLGEFDYPILRSKSEKADFSWFRFMNDINRGRTINGLTYKEAFVEANEHMLTRKFNEQLDDIRAKFHSKLDTFRESLNNNELDV